MRYKNGSVCFLNSEGLTSKFNAPDVLQSCKSQLHCVIKGRVLCVWRYTKPHQQLKQDMSLWLPKLNVFFFPTSPHGVRIHCSLSFLGQRRRTQVSWALGLWCCLHMLSGTTTALAPGSVLRQKTLRFLSPRPQDLEHCQFDKDGRKGNV